MAITNGEVYVAMHSYSEDMLYPWGMTYDQAPNNDALVILLYCKITNTFIIVILFDLFLRMLLAKLLLRPLRQLKEPLTSLPSPAADFTSLVDALMIGL